MPPRHPTNSLAGLHGLLDEANLLVVTPAAPTFDAQYLNLHSPHDLKLDLRSHSQAARRTEQGGRHRRDTLGRLLDRDLSGLRPVQNFIDEVGGAPVQVWEGWSIRHQTSRFDVLTKIVNWRQAASPRQGFDSDPVDGNGRDSSQPGLGNWSKCEPPHS